jgi:hypothetical protein
MLSTLDLLQALFPINDLDIPGLLQSRLSLRDRNQLAGLTISYDIFLPSTSPFLLLLLLVPNIPKTVLSTLTAIFAASRSIPILFNMIFQDTRPLYLYKLSHGWRCQWWHD